MEWPERYGRELSIDSPVEFRLDDEDVDTILDLAADVAHQTERRYAPLSTFLAGWYVGVAVATGADSKVALEAAIRRAHDALESPTDNA